MIIVIVVVYLSTVLQLAYVSEREGGGRRALDASNAAHSMLMALGTHHSHGMVPTLEGRGDDEAEPECEEVYQKPSTSAGLLLPANHQLPSWQQSLIWEQYMVFFNSFQAILVTVARCEAVVLLNNFFFLLSTIDGHKP